MLCLAKIVSGRGHRQPFPRPTQMIPPAWRPSTFGRREAPFCIVGLVCGTAKAVRLATPIQANPLPTRPVIMRLHRNPRHLGEKKAPRKGRRSLIARMTCQALRFIQGESLRLHSGMALGHPAAQSRSQTSLVARLPCRIVLAKNSL
jgi:hypothetical protein